MRYRPLVLVLVTLVGGPLSSAYAGNIVLNGGFETGDFAYWNVNDPSFGTVVSSTSPPEYIPHSGDYFAALGAFSQLGTISQDLNTTAGITYTLDYFLASDGLTPNEFKVVWNGITLSDQVNVPGQNYVEYTFQVTATGASTNLAFYEQNDNGYLSLDDVSVNVASIPEPTSMIPLGTGLVAVACAGGYCRNKASQSLSH